MRTGVKKRGYVSVLRKRPGRTAMELATTPMMERQRKYFHDTQIRSNDPGEYDVNEWSLQQPIGV
jgi:hypothetical protein